MTKPRLEWYNILAWGILSPFVVDGFFGPARYWRTGRFLI
nr:MAG TPA: hypothetical protein [Caudoviricetes sp.]